MIQKPPRCSLDSAYGPSTTSTSEPRAVDGGGGLDRGQAAGEDPEPASRTFWLKASTASKTFWSSSPSGYGSVGVVVHGEHVLGHRSSSWSGSPRWAPSTSSTNGDRRVRHPARAFLSPRRIFLPCRHERLMAVVPGSAMRSLAADVRRSRSLSHAALPTDRSGVVVIGGANVDVRARSTSRAVPATSNPGTVTLPPGGVGRNVAENLARLGTPVQLVAAVGRDDLGDRLLAETAAAGVDVDNVVRTDAADRHLHRRPRRDGELVVAVSDMAGTDATAPRRRTPGRAAGGGRGRARRSTATSATPLSPPASTSPPPRAPPCVLDPVSVPKARRLGTAARERPPAARGDPEPRRAGRAHRAHGRRRVRRASGGGTPAPTRGRARLGPARRRRLDPLDRPPEPSGCRPSPDRSPTSPAPATRCWPRSATRSWSGRPPGAAARLGHAAAALTVAVPQTVRPDLSLALVEQALADANALTETTDDPHPTCWLTDEVAEALRDGAPVVALESTIISHGMPYPQNVAMAREVEGIIRDLGAVPATIAVLDGRPRVGLGDDDLELLGSHPDVDQGQPPRPAVRHGARRARRDDRRLHDAARRPGRDPGLRHRRARRGAPRRAADVRRQRRPDRAVDDRRGRGVGRGEEHPRHRADPRDVWRRSGSRCSRSAPTSSRRSTRGPAVTLAPMRVDGAEEVAAVMRHKWDLGLAVAVSWSPTRSRRPTRSRPTGSA